VRPDGRTLLRIGTAIAATLLTLEVGARVLLRGASAPPGAGPAIPGATAAALAAPVEGVPRALRPYVLHPYLGFVRNRAVTEHALNGRDIDAPVNEFGFFGPPPATRREDEFVVALAGGSVALELFLYAGDRLAQRVAEWPPVAGRKVRLVSLALGGFKQPQQLAALGWLLSRDLHFDLVLNLDGFNEAVLPFTENRAQKIAPDYPRMWRVYTSRSVGADAAVLYGRIFDQKERMAATRDRMGRAPWRWSAFLRWWSLRSLERQAARQGQLEAALRAALADRRITPQEEGPPPRYDDHMFQAFADTWKASSIQMWNLARANDIAYAHFLQPNQYVPDSKPIGEAERRRAVAEPGTPYRTGVERGYPALFEAADDLRRSGVPFFDLTRVFADVPEPVYRDRCCHLNDDGQQRLADAVADALSGLE
jgi:hypothetical protein